jgi:uncharacterized membrane protein
LLHIGAANFFLVLAVFFFHFTTPFTSIKVKPKSKYQVSENVKNYERGEKVSFQFAKEIRFVLQQSLDSTFSSGGGGSGRFL